MSSSRRTRLLENGKTALILLLVISAVYLFGRTQLYTDRGGDGWLQALSALLPNPAATTAAPPEGSGATGLVSAFTPVRVVVTGTAGEGRWGAQYSTDSAAFFDTDGGLLAEALSAADAPRASSAHAFQSALAQDSIFFDLLGCIPLDTLGLWLSHTENPALDQSPVRRLLLDLDAGGAATLYYINEHDGLYYACPLPGDLAGRIATAAQQRRGNGAQFAFEAGDAFDRLSPYVLLLPEPPRPHNYTARMPLGQLGAEVLSPPMEQLLRALGFRPGLASGYPVTGGAVVREGSDSLQVSNAGVVSYQVPEGGDARYLAPDPLEAAWILADRAVGAFAGSARLYLMDVQTEDTRTTVRFGYCLDGAQVILPDGLCAAEFVVDDGVVTAFTLYLRTYEPDGVYATLLPELRAVAAMDALGETGSELVLLYDDNGQGLCVPFWGAVTNP